MTHGLYRVTGKSPYRGHEPGAEFEASIPDGPAGRAIRRGDIEFLAEVVPRIQDGSYRIHPHWLSQSSTPDHRGPQGPLSLKEE